MVGLELVPMMSWTLITKGSGGTMRSVKILNSVSFVRFVYSSSGLTVKDFGELYVVANVL